LDIFHISILIQSILIQLFQPCFLVSTFLFKHFGRQTVIETCSRKTY
jgi:hypothetical protein